MSYGRHPYGGVGYAAADVAEIPTGDTKPALAVEVSFTTGALAAPAWVDIAHDVRSWDVTRGRNRELERFQPGRATVVLGNLSRQYDSRHETGPWYGKLRPMRRIRIRETFNGVTHPAFDGFVDRWHLDYPLTGKDATATVTATDGFKIHGRTDLPTSVYYDEVDTDNPALWWRFDDPQYLFSAIDASGNGRTGTPLGKIKFENQGLIVNDPGSSVQMQEENNTKVVGQFPLDAAAQFTIEFWFMWEEQPAFNQRLVHLSSAGIADVVFLIQNLTSTGQFIITNNAGTVFSSDLTNVFLVGTRYHIVCTHAGDRVLRVFINGVEATYSPQETSSGAADTTVAAVGSSDSVIAATGALVDEFAIYTTALSSAQILTHYLAGTSPWSGDLPGARLERILDEEGWPDDLRALDVGLTSLQSAMLNMTGLEHMQKVAETEFGLLFMDRAGNVRFVDRAAVLARAPETGVVFGDDDGEIGYRAITFDDGDTVIRNRATISRYNGVARTAEDATSIEEFGRFDYALDGLLHSSDTYSLEYAQLIRNEYKDPRRRVTSLALGPADAANAALVVPQMLGRELGDAVEVAHTPPGGGDRFSQTCVIEGMTHSGVPAGPGMRGWRQATWKLSPELLANTAEELLLAENSAVLETESGLEMELE